LNNKTISAARGKNIRLDIFISDQLTDLSRSQIQKMIRDGLVLVNGKESKTGLKLDGNETIQYSFPNRSPELNRITPEDIPLNILHEDEDMIAVNKSAGMVVHPGVGKKNHTLVNGLAFHFKTLSDLNGILRPGIVHRLDEYTSGVILVAKKNQSGRIISQASVREAYCLPPSLANGSSLEGSGLPLSSSMSSSM